MPPLPPPPTTTYNTTPKDAANEQHYEVSSEFYHLALGPRLKYSSGFWPKRDSSFEESEVAMLEMYCERAKLEDGMKVCAFWDEVGEKLFDVFHWLIVVGRSVD